MTLCLDAGLVDGALATTIAWAGKAKLQYALEGNITMTGAAVRWMGEELGVEVIALAARFYGDLGLRQVELSVNSMGCADDRPV